MLMNGLVTGTAAIVLTVIGVVYYLIMVLGYGKMMQKAGEPMWKGLVPFYNTYIFCQLCWKTNMFFVLTALQLASFILSRLGTDSLIINLIYLAVSIALLVVRAKFCGRVVKAYGKGTGTAVGFYFFPVIFSWILGLGSAQYTAPAEN